MYLKETKEVGFLCEGINKLTLTLNEIVANLSKYSAKSSVKEAYIKLFDISKNAELPTKKELNSNAGRIIYPIVLSYTDLISMQIAMNQICKESLKYNVDYILDPMTIHEAEMFLNVIVRGKKQVQFTEKIEKEDYLINGSCLKTGKHESYKVFYESYFNRFHILYVNKKSS